jgi:L-lactate utilization protein LutB
MNEVSFETALSDRVDRMLDACTKCGKCVEVCPSVRPAGISEATPKDVISGVLDIVRTGHGLDASRRWAAACMLSGDCIKACDYGVNPRFLLAMARVSLAKVTNELPNRRRQTGIKGVAAVHSQCPLWVISGQPILGQNPTLSALTPIADKRRCGWGWIVLCHKRHWCRFGSYL